jgi:hypothetical protein
MRGTSKSRVGIGALTLALVLLAWPAQSLAVAPTVTINQAGGQPDPTNGTTVAFSVNFDQSVTGFMNGEVSFAGSTVGGALAAAVVGSGSAYTVTVSGMSTGGSLVVTVPPGVAQNGGAEVNQVSTSTDNTVTIDRTRPTVSIDQAVAQSDPTSSSPINFTATFSEAVVGFGTGDVSLMGSTAPGPLAATVTGAGATRSIAVSGMTGSGTIVASVPAFEASDLAGNANMASTSIDNTVTFNFVPPAMNPAPVLPAAPKKKCKKKKPKASAAAKKCKKKKR